MATIRNTNDGSNAAPYFRADFNMGGLTDLPPWSAGPVGKDPRAVHRAIKEAGYGGAQYGDPAISRELGLGYTAGGRVDRPGEAAALAAAWKKAGCDCGTVHVGRGHESDAEIDTLLRDIIAAS